MTYDYFNQKMSGGKKYPRMFDKIKSVSIILNQKDFELLKDFCNISEMENSNNSFHNQDFTIHYTISKSQKKPKLKQLEISLLEQQKRRNINISPNININVIGKLARFNFKKNP